MQSIKVLTLLLLISFPFPLLAIKSPPPHQNFIKARSHFLLNDFPSAQKSIDLILSSSPKHKLAKSLKARILISISQLEASSRLSTRKKLLNAVSSNWSTPPQPQPHSTLPHQEPYPNDLETTLDSTHIQCLHFIDTPLTDVLDALSSSSSPNPHLSGLNILLISPEKLDPSIDIHLQDTSLKNALELIAKSSNFHYEIENNAVTLHPGPSPSHNLETKFFPITRSTLIKLIGPNTQPSDTEPSLKNFFQRIGIPFDSSAPQGANLAFDGSHLIVSQTKRNLERIHKTLSSYNKIQQVEIEAKFLEVQEGVLEELGFRWNVSNSRYSNRFFNNSTNNNLRNLSSAFNASGSAAGNGQIIQDNSSSTPPSTTKTNIINSAPSIPNSINVGTNTTATASIVGVIKGWQVNTIINALEQHTGADLMSAPKVTVLSGKTAKITVAQVLRYPQSFGDIQSAVGSAAEKTSSAGVTVTAGTPKNFIEKNVGVEMEVTPNVEFDNHHISLKLSPKVTEFEGFIEYGGRSVAISGNTTVDIPSGFFQPIFSTREIDTEVTISNGATVVMGGLTREEVKKINDKVPILGDIPLLGKLFRSKGETNQKRNLLIFVTANIIGSNGNYQDR